MIDLHTHLLFGIDDGPETVAGSIALARAAVEAGTEVMVATPHIDASYGVTGDVVRERADEVRAALEAEGVALTVVTGGEIALEFAMERGAETLAPFVLGDGRWLLLECPFTHAVPFIEKVVYDLRAGGFGVLLAHPERSPALQNDVDRLRSLVDAGAMTQVTAASLSGAFGSTVAGFAKTLVREGLVHVIASDAHDHERRSPDMRAGLDASGLSPAERVWMVRDVPRALLAGEEIPAAPVAADRKLSLRDRLRLRHG